MAAAGFMVLVYLVVIFGMFVLWIKSLIDVLKNQFEGQNTRIIWLALLIFMAPLGTILYQAIGKKQKI